VSQPAANSTWWIDSVRASVLRPFAPWLGPLFADRSRRVAWMGVVSVTTSFVLTLVAPLWLLALGPILLGVPHLVADARYLVVQPGLHRRGALAWLAALPLVATGFGAPAFVSLLSIVPAVLMANGTRARKSLALVAWAALSAVALRWEFPFLLGFLHLHNVVALGWWWAMRPRTKLAALVPLAVLAGTAAIFLGVGEPVISALGGWEAPLTGASFNEYIESNAPELGATMAIRLVLSFAFLQSVHYAMWLRLVPEDARTRTAPRPFEASWQALKQDFGVPALLAFAGLALFIAAWGALDLAQARWGYLRLAGFHGYLELAAAAFFFVERKRPAC
jgi:hypothetical protein